MASTARALTNIVVVKEMISFPSVTFLLMSLTNVASALPGAHTSGGLRASFLRNLLSASRVGFRISVVNSNAAHVGLSSPHPVFQVLEPVVALTEAVTVI